MLVVKSKYESTPFHEDVIIMQDDQKEKLIPLMDNRLAYAHNPYNENKLCFVSCLGQLSEEGYAYHVMC